MPGVFGLRETRIEKIKNISTSSFRYWSESAKYGYFGGGYTSISNIIRLDFSNETVSDPGKSLPISRGRTSGVYNNSYGYFGGGYRSGSISTITRLDFSNETVFDPGNNFVTIRYSAAGVANVN
jgi:hypothetical protein